MIVIGSLKAVKKKKAATKCYTSILTLNHRAETTEKTLAKTEYTCFSP